MSIDKIQQIIHNPFAKSRGISYIPKNPINPQTSGTGRGFYGELNEVASYGAKKADTSTTIGLGGASTPPEGKGQKLWDYC